MDRKVATPENLNWILDEMKKQLKLVNATLIRTEDYDLDRYDELYDLYELIEKKQGNLTMMEIEGILEELRELKK